MQLWKYISSYMERRKQASCWIISSMVARHNLINFIPSKDPSICLNYAVMLYKCGDRRAAAKVFSQFHKKLEPYKASNGGAIDPQVTPDFSYFLTTFY